MYFICILMGIFERSSLTMTQTCTLRKLVSGVRKFFFQHLCIHFSHCICTYWLRFYNKLMQKVLFLIEFPSYIISSVLLSSLWGKKILKLFKKVLWVCKMLTMSQKLGAQSFALFLKVRYTFHWKHQTSNLISRYLLIAYSCKQIHRSQIQC